MYPQTPAKQSPFTYQRLNYLKTALEVLLLLLALPWVIRELFRNPLDTGRRLAGAHKPLQD